MTDQITVTADELAAAATRAAAQLKKVAHGKPAAQATRSTAGSFGAVAAMLDSLVLEARRRRDEQARLERALNRIANLQLRNATELLERQDWKRIASELQTIAQEALLTPARG